MINRVSGHHSGPGEKTAHPPEIHLDIASIAERLQTLQARFDSEIATLPLTVTVKIPATDPLEWLRCQAGRRRQYWSSRSGDQTLAGSGCAMEITAATAAEISPAYRRIEKILDRARGEEINFLGGQVFDPDSELTEPWSGFPLLGFTQPEITLQKRGDLITATLAVPVESESTPEGVLNRLAALAKQLNGEPTQLSTEGVATVLSRVDLPDYPGWRGGLEGALERIQRGDMEKVVLARRTELRLNRAIDPLQLLQRLTTRNPNCFGFMYEPTPGLAFLGASPERLFRLAGRELTTEAMAGTALPSPPTPEFAADPPPHPSGSDHGDRELLSCEKNGREHDHVLQFIKKRLATLCAEVHSTNDRELIHLSNVTHICAELTGELNPELGMGDVAARLHPTPAVCGMAPVMALRTIGEVESFGRGWYSGVVGVIGGELTELTVGIRSAVVAGDRVTTFAGAGIVGGSRPRSEWLELEAKIKPVIDTFGGS